MGTTTLASPDSNPECTRAQHDMIDMVLSKAPQYIFQDPNFDNPWYVLEIQEIRGELRFNLALKYAYQLLISSLKDASQLVLRNPVGLQNRHWLYERSNSHTVGKLGKLACIGYLGDDGTVNTAKFVFIKVLDLGSGLEKNGEPSIDKIEQVNGIYEEINLLNSIPGHPNIIPPPMGYIALGNEEGVEIQGRKIIGYVNQYYENGRLSDYIFLPREPGKPRTPKPITILQKAKWALQIASAVFHLHREAGLSMGDGGRGFGLERFMVDEYRQLHLGGFGGSEAVSRASWRVPPEVRVRGEWEVREEITRNRERHGIRKLAWRHNKYIRLRWEQDNLRKAMGDMDPSLIPPPSPGICGNNGTNSCANSNINSGSTGSNRTISKSNTDSCDSIRKSSAGSFDSYDSYKSNNNSIVEALNPIGGGDGDADVTDGGEEEGRNDRIDKSWSAFDEWHLTPKALEIVETYSLGVMLWLVFEQVLPENLPKGSEDLVITWSVDSRVPREWRRIVEACVERNPADRIGMREVLRCFVGEVGRRWDGGWLTG